MKKVKNRKVLKLFKSGMSERQKCLSKPTRSMMFANLAKFFHFFPIEFAFIPTQCEIFHSDSISVSEDQIYTHVRYALCTLLSLTDSMLKPLLPPFLNFSQKATTHAKHPE